MRTIRQIAAMFLLVLMLPVFGQGQAQSCATYNNSGPGGPYLFTFNLLDGTGHTTTNQHGLYLSYYGTCTYSAVTNNQTVCSTDCYQNARMYASKYENQNTISNVLLWHSVGSDGNTGTAYNPQGSASCGATAAVAVTSCSIVFTTCPSSPPASIRGTKLRTP